MTHTCETCNLWGDAELSKDVRVCHCAECSDGDGSWTRTRYDWRCNHHAALEAARTRLDIAARLLAGHYCADVHEVLRQADALIAAAGEEKA